MEEEVKAAKEKREPLLLPNFSVHYLRHTFCTRFCENETNIKVIQSVMGHKDIHTTMDVYAEATGSKKQEAMQNLSAKWKEFSKEASAMTAVCCNDYKLTTKSLLIITNNHLMVG